MLSKRFKRFRWFLLTLAHGPHTATGAILMRLRRLGWPAALLAASLLAATAGAASRCKLVMSPQLPVRMDNLRPVITANINGVDAQFILDTGSFFDFMSPAAAAQFKLPLSYAPPGYYINGIGGSVIPQVATVNAFTVAGVTVHDALFFVGTNDFQGGEVGLLGQNLLRLADVDYDFADGSLRFVNPSHCSGPVVAYWTTTLPVGVVNLHWTSRERPHLIGEVSVNGQRIQALFDTGSPRTILSLRAAKWAGITPDSPGVIPAGMTSGIGKGAVRVWIAPIDKFEVGGEMIEHTRVLIGDIDLASLDVQMLLGTDFFLAHHVYVAYSQNKLYFTYNGGVVFDLNARRPAQAAGAQSTPQPGGPAGSSGPQALPAAVSDLPTDAAGFMRRGMAHASRADYPEAIADLTRACDLDPTNADCRYQRGLAYWHSAQRKPALADFNAAIQLQPNGFDAHMARAELELRRQPAGAAADLDAVDRLAPQEADLRLTLARLYGAAGEYAGAVHQYDLWIEYHPDDLRLSYALAGRCGSEAAANVDVDRALEDCNTALRSIPKPASAQAVSNRGLAYLRRGRLDSALADFETALKLQPRLFIARYGLALVELKKGLKEQGQNDLLAVQTARPELARRLAAAGLKP